MEEKKEYSPEEIAKRYNIDLEKLKKEQEKLAKSLSIKDNIDFSLIERAAGIENVFFKNRIISAIVVLNLDCEIIEQEYFSDKIKFPYISGFRAYRELPCMVSAFNKLDEKPDVVFIHGNGILHPRHLGLASHFSLACNVPTIGISDSLLKDEEVEIKEDKIFLKGELCGKILRTKEGSNPVYVSPGNMISLDSSINLIKKFIREPHKLPEPLIKARKYAKEIMKELFKV